MKKTIKLLSGISGRVHKYTLQWENTHVRFPRICDGLDGSLGSGYRSSGAAIRNTMAVQPTGHRGPAPSSEERLATVDRMRHTFREAAALFHPTHQGRGTAAGRITITRSPACTVHKFEVKCVGPEFEVIGQFKVMHDIVPAALYRLGTSDKQIT